MIEHRVIGPPGTGKTTFLGRQAQLAAQRYSPGDVMIASLTRAAAKEIGSRDTGIPADNVGTLHAHAFRALDRPLLAETAEGLREWNKFTRVGRYRLTNDSDSDADSPWEMSFETEGDQLLSQLSALRARMTPRAVWPMKVRRFAREWENFKQARARLDFTDLVEFCLSSVDRPSCRPKVIMLDEAQDFSRLELMLARSWAKSAEQIVVVGDPDQNLYQWRGTDPDGMFETPASTERVLEQSWRVPKAVHEYAVRWIETIPDREPVSYRPTEVEGDVRKSGATFQNPDALLKLVRRDLDAGRSVMVLATCGYMLNPLITTLRGKGIPFHNPYRVTHGGWNPLRGTKRILSYLQPNTDQGWTYSELAYWSEPLNARSVMQHGAKAEIAQIAEVDPGRVAELVDLSRYFRFDSLAAAVGGDIDWYVDSIRPSRRQQMSYGAKLVHRHGVDALLNEPSVVVGTIHSVKGGEADSVYVFPDLSNIGYTESWSKRSARPSVIRQFYVAFTRARQMLTICGASSGEAPRLPRI